MTGYWQEIIAFLIIGSAVWFLIRKYFIRKNKRKNHEVSDPCSPCSSSSCDGCAVKDLLNEIEDRRRQKGSGSEKSLKKP